MLEELSISCRILLGQNSGEFVPRFLSPSSHALFPCAEFAVVVISLMLEQDGTLSPVSPSSESPDPGGCLRDPRCQLPGILIGKHNVAAY